MIQKQEIKETSPNGERERSALGAQERTASPSAALGEGLHGAAQKPGLDAHGPLAHAVPRGSDALRRRRRWSRRVERSGSLFAASYDGVREGDDAPILLAANSGQTKRCDRGELFGPLV